jgi:SecD/SecF fusion protein
MPKNVLWKFLPTAFLVLVSFTLITPFDDQDLAEHALSESTSDANATLYPNYLKFEKVLNEVKEGLGEDEKVEFKSLKDFGTQNRLDYAEYFKPPTGILGTVASRLFPFVVKPGIRASYEQDREKRNDIVLRALLRNSQASIRKGLDLRGGVAFTLEIQPSENESNATLSNSNGDSSAMDKVVEIMSERLNAFGVAETIVRKKGETTIEVQIPDRTTKQNPEMIEELQRPARLAFHMVSVDPKAPVNPLEGDDWVNDDGTPFVALRNNARVEEVAWVTRYPQADGDILDKAAPRQDQSGGWYVALDFTSEGGQEFANLTGEIANSNTAGSIGRLAVVLDGVLESAPTVKKRIDGGSAVIEGSFTRRESKMLSDILNNPLKVSLAIGEKYEVSPTLAEDAMESSTKACLLGAFLVIAFMITWYKAGGLMAVFSVATNVLLVVAALAGLFQATFTLPGIAAIVLTVGMAVDANILIFERIREELRTGKSAEAALAGGYEKAFSTIIDANLTTLLTASILIWLGTGPVKGFGVTLAIGILVSMFCALVVSRFLMEMLLHYGVKNLISFKAIDKGQPRQPIDFHKHRRLAFAISWIIVAIGIFAVNEQKDNILGIDFQGGEELIASFDQRIDTADLEKVVKDSKLGEVQTVYRSEVGSGEKGEYLVLQTEANASNVLLALNEAHPKANLVEVGSNTIGGSVSEQIQHDAIISVSVALLGILLYVAFRFEVGYAVGAVIATIHDVLMTVGLFVLIGFLSDGSLCSGQFTAPMLASILMIVGYSINDTIVVFDRIREELLMNPVTNLRKIILIAINRVLSRTIITSATTLMAALSLWIFGAGVIHDFAFVFVIGILTGTFSSIFIASPIFYWWHKGDRKHVEEREFIPKYDWQTSSKT